MENTTYKIGTIIKAQYWTGVYARCGWRTRGVVATLKVISAGKAEVLTADMEQADSNRQKYNVCGTERREVGRRKIISCLNDVEIVSEPIEAAV